jgi:hypothetical protein
MLVTETINEIIDFLDILSSIITSSSLLFFIFSSECITASNINFNILRDDHFALDLSNNSLKFFRKDKLV